MVYSTRFLNIDCKYCASQVAQTPSVRSGYQDANLTMESWPIVLNPLKYFYFDIIEPYGCDITAQLRPYNLETSEFEANDTFVNAFFDRT